MQRISQSSNSLEMRLLKYANTQFNYEHGSNEIQIVPASYSNLAKRIHIPDVPEHAVPGSPEDLKIPVAPSGTMSPMAGLGVAANISEGISVIDATSGLPMSLTPTQSGVNTPTTSAQAGTQPLKIGKVPLNPMD